METFEVTSRKSYINLEGFVEHSLCFYFSKDTMHRLPTISLLQQNHLLRINKISSLDSVEIYSTR